MLPVFEGVVFVKVGSESSLVSSVDAVDLSGKRVSAAVHLTSHLGKGSVQKVSEFIGDGLDGSFCKGREREIGS